MKTKNFFLFFLILFAFFTRFYNLSYPPKVVFDETHFGLYATKYLSHQYYFDIHPPFGKLILGLGVFLSGSKSDFQFPVGAEYENFNYLFLRGIVAFFGFLFVILIYFLAKELGFSEKGAFLASFLVLFDNALLVQSRLILLDTILVFFIFLSFYFLILEKKYFPFSKKWFLFNFLFGLSAGCAISIKLTGFGILFLWSINLFGNKLFLKSKKYLLIKISLNLILPLLCYFFFYFVHFSLAFEPCFSNCGAVLDRYLEKNLSQPEKKSLLFYSIGYSESFFHFINFPPSANFFENFIQTQKFSLAGNLTGDSSCYDASDWYSFPFMIRPIGYFFEKKEEKISQIWFFGNPLVWWLSFLSVIGTFYLVLRSFFLKSKFKIPPLFSSENFISLVAGYLSFLLPLAAVKRFVLPYHYLTSLVFSILIFAGFCDGVLKFYFSQKTRKFTFYLLLLLVFLSFFYFSPFTFGFPLSSEEIKKRIWFSTWEFLTN